ncbi:MAG: hypothetical protein QNJ29_12060 [Rhizobiaceae bacterium]|nr:hypothetical protein [Rhizobiaceae bacterium]
MIDKKAKKILFDYYWSSGWKNQADRTIETNDLEHARANGFWFDPLTVTHNELVDWLIDLREELRPEDVGNAFLASLSTRRLDIRSALASYAYAKHFPAHKFPGTLSSLFSQEDEFCRVCGEYNIEKCRQDLNVLNFERHKWGGVRHAQPLYAWFDLERFKELPAIEPSDADLALMRQIIEIASSLRSDARPIVLAKALSGIIKSNDAERRTMIEILSISGVLQPKNEGGYFGAYTAYSDRRQTNEHTNDWSYPAIWWRGADGVNMSAVAYYFPDI